ncbi:MAG: 3-oxoacyl-ACP synthase [Spirochaetales bacterium]|jgi:3-oxoacyl-[acyl-carrier-protein] synthase-1|nr:3-oxoacyl-ACP synthase [Spirochaetales bacterium]
MRGQPVYLSAPGILCCAGSGGTQFYAAAREGVQSGIRPVTLPDGRSFLSGRIADKFLRPAAGGFDMRLLRIADAALEQIRADIEGAAAAYGPDRIAVCVGSCDNGSECSLAAHKAYFADGFFPENYDLRIQGAAYPADFIARKFGLSGPSAAVSTACASSAGAIVRAAELIRAGWCDAAIAGGVDVASETVLLGFGSLEAVSETVCNPFSKNRSGITLGEGAAFFVVSRSDISGAGIELAGSGESSDAFHLTAPRADGGGAAAAMRSALADAGMQPEEVGYINAHGTGTPLNDSMEALALAAVFPKICEAPLVSSTKPITGHTLGAAGALELALCWLTLCSSRRDASVPVHCWDGVYDQNMPALRFAGPGTCVKDLRACMSNSFAFGGCNTSLILKKN